ncbi:mucin-2-like [Physella acuta]|uniref:mucin-2-like n=1 Tax=Physella acuta TaxID=109671 RepID=UPI0027DC074B|nr:mucin-2-like [Physella acuta]
MMKSFRFYLLVYLTLTSLVATKANTTLPANNSTLTSNPLSSESPTTLHTNTTVSPHTETQATDQLKDNSLVSHNETQIPAIGNGTPNENDGELQITIAPERDTQTHDQRNTESTTTSSTTTRSTKSTSATTRSTKSTSATTRSTNTSSTTTSSTTMNTNTQQSPFFVSPNKSLISGGTWINITGQSLTSRTVVYLDVSYEPTTNTTFECNSPADTTEILCRSPNLAGSITQNLFTPKGFVTYPLVIQPDGQEKHTVTFEIHPNPSFHQLLVHGIKVFQYNDTFVVFILRGNRIPSWLQMEDIKIEIEDLNCEVFEASATDLICSSQEVNLHNQKYNPNTDHVIQSPKLVTDSQLNAVADGTKQALTKALKKLSANLSRFLNNETSNEPLYVNVSITLGNFKDNHTVTLHWHQVNVGDPMLSIFAAVGGCSSAVLLAVCLLVILRSKSKAKKEMNGRNSTQQGIFFILLSISKLEH